MVFGSFLPHQTEERKKNVIKVGPPLTKLSGFAHAVVCCCCCCCCCCCYCCLLASFQFASSEVSVETARLRKLVSAFNGGLCYKHPTCHVLARLFMCIAKKLTGGSKNHTGYTAIENVNTIDERRSKIVSNIRHWRQMAIENTVSSDF